MEKNPSWEGNGRSASEEILHLLRNETFITVFTKTGEFAIEASNNTFKIHPYIFLYEMV